MNSITISRLTDALLEAEGAELENVGCTATPSTAFLRRIQRLAEHPEKYAKSRRAKKTVIILIAAALILTGCTAIKPVRTVIADFIVTIYKEGSFVDKSTDKNGKKRITEFYTPAFIPEGYEFVEEIKNKLKEDYTVNRYLKYKNGDEELIFCQLTVQTSLTLDTENAVIKTFTVNGIECMSSENTDNYIVVWEQYGYRFMMTMPAEITEETAKRIIESVEKVEVTD